MNTLLVLPLVIPLAAAALSMLAWKWVRVQRTLAVAGTAALLAASSALMAAVLRHDFAVSHMGDWPAPFGITLVADLFSAAMLLVTAVVGLCVAVYSLASVDTPRESYGFYPMFHLLLMGVCGAFLTGDLFNLYVWFEVMLMASFVLLALGGEKPQLEGGIKYVSLNLLSSALFLAGVGMIYGLTGTLNMAHLAQKLATTRDPTVTAVAMLFFVAFGIKAAVFPLFFWLPASYHTPPVAVSAVFAGLLTKVGVYALIRTFTLLFVQRPEQTHLLILIVSGLTMVTGVLGAAAQFEFRRILSFHIISQIGYMTMGLGLAGLAASPAAAAAALAASIFYIVHHIIVKTNLFLISGAVQWLGGSFELKQLGGLYRSRPGLAVLFLIPAMSLSGLPPLSGFFAKLALVKTGLEMEQYAIVAVALAVGLLTLYSMTKIWNEVFWKPRPEDAPVRRAALQCREESYQTQVPGEVKWGDGPEPEVNGGARGTEVPHYEHDQKLEAPNEEPGRHTAPAYRAMLIPIALLAVITVAIGIAAGPLFQLATRAAEQLVNPRQYIEAVLGESP